MCPSNESNWLWAIGKLPGFAYFIFHTYKKGLFQKRIEMYFLLCFITFRSGVGSSGSMQTLYYCEVTDADKVNGGGGIDDEIIEVFELTLDECREMLKQGSTNNAPPSCLFGISWFLANKLTKWSNQIKVESNEEGSKQQKYPHSKYVFQCDKHKHLHTSHTQLRLNKIEYQMYWESVLLLT